MREGPEGTEHYGVERKQSSTKTGCMFNNIIIKLNLCKDSAPPINFILVCSTWCFVKTSFTPQ